MNCSEFEQAHTVATATRAEPLPSALREHADVCERCAALVAEDAVLARALPAWLSDLPAVDLTEMVLSRWRDEHSESSASESKLVKPAASPRLVASAPERDQRSSARFAVLTIALTVCLLAIVPLVLSKSSPVRGPSADVAGTVAGLNTDATHPKPGVEEPAPEIDGLVRNVGSAYMGLASDVGTTLSDAAGMIPSVDFRPSIDGADTGPELPPNPVSTREWTNDFKPIGKKAWRRAAPKDVIVELKHQGQRYYRRTASKNDGNGSNSKDSGRPVYYVKLDAVFALSDNENAIRDVIARSQSADGKSLARSKRYLQARQSLTGTPVVTLYFNPRQWDDSMEFRKNDGPASALLQQFWKQCNSVVVGVRLDGGCVTEVVADFDPDGLPAAWSRLAAQTAGAADFLSRIPREAVLAVAGRYDPNLILAAIRLNQTGEDDKHWKAFQRYARVFLLGVDLSTELVPSLRTNGGLYVVPRATSNKAVFPFDGLAAVEIVEATGNADNAADEFRAKLDRGLANGATVLATFYNLSQAKKENTAEQGLALVQSAKRHGTRIRWVDGIGEYRPAVALTKKYLVVASSPELIEDFVAPAKKNRLQSTTVFQRWKQRYFPNENQLVYVNIRGLHDHIRSVRPVLVGWLSGGRSASRQPAGKRLDRALDLLQVIDGAFAAAQISKSEVRLVFGGVVKPTDSARDSKP
eukprot:g22003.t1